MATIGHVANFVNCSVLAMRFFALDTSRSRCASGSKSTWSMATVNQMRKHGDSQNMVRKHGNLVRDVICQRLQHPTS